MKNIIYILLLVAFYSNAQALKQVEICEHKYQKCLDSGSAMKICAITFYSEADSLLNLSYKKIKNQLNISEKRNFLTEQRNWLKSRDKYFEVAFEEAKNENGGSTISDDFKMMFFNKKAEFVIERVKKLILRINK